MKPQEPKESRISCTEDQMMNILNHQRHDWMNNLQVLFGYIRMQKYDKLLDYMGKINAKAHQESLISKLGVPSLIWFYHSYRAESRELSLEFEMDEEINLLKLAVDPEMITRLIREVVGLFTESAETASGEPNTLSLSFDVEESGLLLDFVYQGAYRQEQAEAKLDRMGKDFSSSVEQMEREMETNKAVIGLMLPFHKH